MNFRRGRQMVVHDPTLNNPGNPAAVPPVLPTPLVPPVAFRCWTVHPHNSVQYILTRVAAVATDAQGLDAVHFLAHGYSGGIQLGREHLGEHNVQHFALLRGLTRFVVFFSCQVGGQHRGGSWHRGHPVIFGQRVVAACGATVVVAQQTQFYTWNPDRMIDFGVWEGPVDVVGEGTIATHQDDNPFRREPQLDLEGLIFGPGVR